MDAEETVEAALDALVIGVSRRLRAVVQLLECRRHDGALTSLTLRVERPGQAAIDIDIAHVSTFEADTWEPPPRELATLVGARGHTLHSRAGQVEFRLATWVDRFDPDSVAWAVRKRLLAERRAPRRVWAA